MPLPILVRQLIDRKLAGFCERRLPPYARDEIRLFHTVRGNSATADRNSKWHLYYDIEPSADFDDLLPEAVSRKVSGKVVG